MKLTIPTGLALAAGLLAGCSSVPGAAAPPPPVPTMSSPSSVPVASPATWPVPAITHRHPTPSARPAAHRPRPGTLLAIADEGRVTYSVTLHPGQCHARDGGRLPDPACTPGSTDPAVTQATIGRTICVSGWTATVRPPSGQTTAAKYDVARPAYGSTTSGELDHLVPLELGGSNDITNLWPETGRIPNPKDPVENELKAAVCAGTITLYRARLAIARNWENAPVMPAAPRASTAPVAAVPASRAAAAPSSHAAAASCYPRTSGGNCYRAGEFCRKSDLGASGVAGNGERIRCVTSGSRNRWEAA